MRLKSPQGQIATIFIVLIALVFIFMAITINIGKIINKRTALDIAADSAALAAGSGLGSYAYTISTITDWENGLCQEYWDWGSIVGFIISMGIGFITGGIAGLFLGFALSTMAVMNAPYLKNPSRNRLLIMLSDSQSFLRLLSSISVTAT